MQSYLNKSTNREMNYFNIVGLNGEEFMQLRVYMKTKFNTVQEGLSFKFSNIIEKDSNTFWVTSQSKIAYTSIVPTNIDLEKNPPCLPEEIPIDGLERTLKVAVKTPEKSVVKGKVVKVSPIHYRKEGTLPVKSLIMKDTENSVAKVCLFARNAEIPISDGDMIKITSVYPKLYNNRTQLTATPATQCEFVTPDPTIEVQHCDADSYENDPDFQDDHTEGVTEEILLTDFTDVDLYDCCDEEACRKKKIKNNMCPVCLKTSSKMKTFRVSFLMSTKKETDKEISLFQSTIEKVTGESIECDTKEDLINNILTKLPISLKACLTQNNTLYNIQG